MAHDEKLQGGRRVGRRKRTREELVDSRRLLFRAEECSQTEEWMCLEEGPIGMDGDRGVEAQWKRSAVLLVLELLL